MPHHVPHALLLQPGTYVVARAPGYVRTLLGSCVAVTLWHPIRRVGAMSHFLLASRQRDRQQPRDARYGDEALALMLEGLSHLGVLPSECEAKVFGGGAMFALDASRHDINIGRRNGEAAQQWLAKLGMPVRASHLYGEGHRQILFNLGTGDVWVRQVPLRPGHALPTTGPWPAFPSLDA